jgi:PAS domain S-box-containing protein
VASALAGGTMSLAAVTRLDERGHSLSFSRQLLAATFENIEAGIAVVDADLNLVAWNTRYEQLFSYPAMLYVGAPVADLIRHNARRGDFGRVDIEHQVSKRLAHLRRGQEYTLERHRPDGQVIKMVGRADAGRRLCDELYRHYRGSERAPVEAHAGGAGNARGRTHARTVGSQRAAGAGGP